MWKKFKNTFLESNRWKHFLLGIPVGSIFTILAVLGAASGMEYKDKLWGSKWDWYDWLWTVTGGLAGQLIQIGIILLIL